MDVRSGAGQSSYRYGKSERFCCDDIAGLLAGVVVG